MKRIFLLFALSILKMSFVNASSIDTTLAKIIATNFYSQNSNKVISTVSLTYKESTSLGDTMLYYVYNINQQDGWVMVSADSSATPILAYSLSGSYNSNISSPNLAFWLNEYKEQLLNIKIKKLPPTLDIQNKWKSYQNSHVNSASSRSNGAGPLISTEWSQGQYYNDLCPVNCPTGCVATAMAQIMKFWSSPTTGTGYNSYVSTYGTQSMNFASITFDWNGMTQAATYAYNPIDTLMYACGVSVNMNYAPAGSSACVLTNDYYGYNQYSAQNAYATYFGYNPSTISGVQRTDYTDDNWIQSILEPELDAGRPIQYEGWDATGAGHTWVCDGYDANNMFHMNWGWGGIDETTYYAITQLNPGQGSLNFILHEGALIGIQPLTSTTGCVDNNEPNDDIGNATPVFQSPLNNEPANSSVQADIGWAGDQDWYRMDLTNPGTLTINLSNLPYNYYLQLYGIDGTSELLAGSYLPGTSPQQITYTYTGTSTTIFALVFASNSSDWTTASCYDLQFSWSPTTIVNLPDLYIYSTGLDSTIVHAGSYIPVTAVVGNLGPGSASNSYLGYYLSADCNIDASSILLDSSYIGPLSSGSNSSPQYVTLTIPSNTVPGTYYILFVANFNGSVSESNYSNNMICFPITVLPKPTYLPYLDFAGSAGVGSNDSITYTFNYTIGNSGNANANSFYINFYVCTADTFLNPIFVGEDAVSQGLVVNQTYTNKVSINLCDAGLKDGAYYFGIYIDYAHQIIENNQGENNQFYSSEAFPVFCPNCNNPPTVLTVSNISQAGVELNWSQDTNAVTYNLSYLPFGGVWSSNIITSGTNYDLTGLSCNTDYEIRISANCSVGTSPYLVDSFITQDCCPSTSPTLSYPENSTTVYGDTITFQWYEVADATNYLYQISRDQYFNTVELETYNGYDTVGNNISIVLNTFSQDGTDYYWRVMALGNSCNSSFSPIFNFFSGDCDNTYPPVPIPYYPVDGTPQCGSDTVDFNWSSTSCATSYEFQVSTDSSFGNNSSIGDYISSWPSIWFEWTAFDQSSDVWYWRVSEENSIGWGDWTDPPNYFTTCTASAIQNVESMESKLSVMPNPNTGSFNLLLTNAQIGQYSIKIFDELGELVDTRNGNCSTDKIIEHFSTEELAKGLYLIQLIENNRSITTNFSKL